MKGKSCKKNTTKTPAPEDKYWAARSKRQTAIDKMSALDVANLVDMLQK